MSTASEALQAFATEASGTINAVGMYVTVVSVQVALIDVQASSITAFPRVAHDASAVVTAHSIGAVCIQITIIPCIICTLIDIYSVYILVKLSKIIMVN